MEPLNYRLNGVTCRITEMGELRWLQPATWLERLCSFLLRFNSRPVLLGQDQEVTTLLREENVDFAFTELMPLIHEQLRHLHLNRVKPSRVIMGPDTYRRLMQQFNANDFTLYPNVTHGDDRYVIPMFMGLEIVITPFFEGVLVI